VSNIQRFENVKQVVKLVQPEFEVLAKIHGAVNYQREASFALQLLAENYILANAAINDPDSLKRAIINIAAIGLSLNPIKKHAYLIPRGKKVCLEISYLGLVHLAVEVGAVAWVAAEIVCEKDKYKFRGLGREPLHEFDPFADMKARGEIRGAYCLAKTHTGDFIVTQMSNEEILLCRDRSESYQAWLKDNSKLTPWKTDTTEMIKKTVIRRGDKSWPKTDTRQDRLERALELANDAEMQAIVAPLTPQLEDKRALSLKKLRDSLGEYGRKESDFIVLLTRVTRRELKKLEDLTDIEIGQAQAMLNQLIRQQPKKKKEAASENVG
jgi:recombination protein RecT